MAARKTGTKGNRGTKNEMIEAMIKLNKSSKANAEQKEIILNNFMNAQEIGGKVFLYIPLKYLKVDHESYQRAVYKHAQKISEAWDIRKCDPLIVNYRKDGFFYIIDGQHRYKAAQIKGVLCLVCVVFVGLSVEEESEIFSDVNILSKKLIPYETFKSNICHGEQVDTIIKNVCDKYGIAVEKSKSPKTLRCITLCRKIVKKDLSSGDGTETLNWIFGLLGECNWSIVDPMTYTQRVFAALEHVRLANRDSLDYVKDKLVSAFDIVSYEDLSAFASMEYPLYGKDSGFIMVIKGIAEGTIEVTDDIKNRIRRIA